MPSSSNDQTSRSPVADAPEAVAAAAHRLRAWVFSGACQSPNGAFVAWFDLAEGRRAYDYPEISGYALTYLAGQRELSDREWTAGERAAEWLVERVQAGTLAARDGWDDDAVYLFDLAMIASGLLSFGRRTEVERYLETGRRLAGFLHEEISSAHAISPVLRHGPPSGRMGWSSLRIPHLAKLVQSFLLADEPGSGAARLIETVKALQAADGRMQSGEGGTTTMLHPHLYAAEGLWIWASAAGDPDALERAKAAVDWVWAYQLERGGLPRSAPPADRAGAAVEQSDVTAQAVRLALALGLRSTEVERATTRLLEIAREQPAGLGMPYEPGFPSVHLNVWATLFAAQALAMAPLDARRLTWQQLV